MSYYSEGPLTKIVEENVEEDEVDTTGSGGGAVGADLTVNEDVVALNFAVGVDVLETVW